VTGEKSPFELSKPSSSMATKSSSGASVSIAQHLFENDVLSL
jgi:hypothetical protein